MSHRWKFMLGFGSALGLAASAALAAAPPAPAPARAAAPPAAKPAGPSDKAQIEAMEARFSAAFNAKDVARVMACYAHDGLFVFDVSPPRQHVGWDDYKKDWEGLFAGMPGPITFKMSDLDITVVGQVAYGHSIQDVRSTGPGGAAQELTVRVSDVYRKIGGKWRIVQEHVSVPVDLGTGRAD